MSRKLAKFKPRAMFTFVGGVLVINPAFGQETQTQAQAQAPQQAQAQAAPDATTLDSVVVTGIRGSLSQAMDIKREPDPKGDRVNVVLSGKFLPYKTY